MSFCFPSFLATRSTLVRVPLAFGVGLTLFGLAWLVLAIMGRFDPLSLVISTGLVLAVLLTASYQTTGDWRRTVGP